MVFSVVTFLLVTIVWIYFLWSRRKFYALRLKMPGPIGIPLIGALYKLRKVEDILYELSKMACEYNSKTFFGWFGPLPVIYTMDPDIAKIFLNSPDCINKSSIYDVLDDVIGNGLILSESARWSKHRKLLSPAFSHKVLLDFIPNFNKNSHELCDELENLVNCGEVNIKDLLLKLTLKSSVASTMGIDLHQGADVTFMRHFEKVQEGSIYRIFNPSLRYSSIFKLASIYRSFNESNTFIRDFVHKLVMDKIKICEQQELQKDNKAIDSAKESIDITKTKHIFIDQAIKIYQRKEFTFYDIVAESKTTVFAAFETTASTLFSTIMCLAMHPEYQEKVYEEILTVFPEKEFDVKYEDLKDLVYLDMCINETLRVVTTVPIIGRVCSKDVPLPGDIVVPKGTEILIDMLSIHRDEDTWGPNAKAFNPDNFLPENLSNHHKYSFMPYVKGIRTCIGWNYAGIIMKVVLAHVLRKYRFSTKFRFEDLKFMDHITIKYQDLPNFEIQSR